MTLSSKPNLQLLCAEATESAAFWPRMRNESTKWSLWRFGEVNSGCSGDRVWRSNSAFGGYMRGGAGDLAEFKSE